MEQGYDVMHLLYLLNKGRREWNPIEFANQGAMWPYRSSTGGLPGSNGSGARAWGSSSMEALRVSWSSEVEAVKIRWKRCKACLERPKTSPREVERYIDGKRALVLSKVCSHLQATSRSDNRNTKKGTGKKIIETWENPSRTCAKDLVLLSCTLHSSSFR